MRMTVVAVMVLAASAVVAQADPLKLKVGAASNGGSVSFTLAAKGDSGVESVVVSVDFPSAVTAQDKAAVIRDAVANAGVAGTWRTGSSATVAMTFEHLVEGEWKPVDQIINLVDTTGSGTSLQTKDQAVDFSLDIDPYASASGYDLEGGPSFLTIAVTNTLTFTRAVEPGESAESLVAQFEAFLAEQEAEGVVVERTGPTSLRISLDGSSSAALNWQITDSGLLGEATAGAVVGAAEVGDDTGDGRMIDR